MQNPRINNCKSIDVAIQLLEALEGKKKDVFSRDAVGMLIKNTNPMPEQDKVNKLLKLAKIELEKPTSSRPAIADKLNAGTG